MTKIVFEIGINHTGSLDLAKEMIQTFSTYAHGDVIKFQKRCPKELLTEAEYNAPHPNPEFAFGETYGKHREALEFTIDQHAELKGLCERYGSIYSTSVWDMTSTKEVVCLNPQYIKIPSACNLRFDILDYLCQNYSGQIHISLGMTSRLEEEEIVDFIFARGRIKDLVFYACTSGYPIDFEDVCLLEITRLKKKWGKTVRDIGFSYHGLGIAMQVAAVALGANWLEMHVTSDRCIKTTDAAASLEIDGARKVVRDVRALEKAMQYKHEDLLAVELLQFKKMKRRVNI